MPSWISQTNSQDHSLTTASHVHHKTKGFEIWDSQVTAITKRSNYTSHTASHQYTDIVSKVGMDIYMMGLHNHMKHHKIQH
jgi:hypothetical protein